MAVLAKLTAKNQLTLPKSAAAAVGLEQLRTNIHIVAAGSQRLFESTTGAARRKLMPRLCPRRFVPPGQ